MGGGNGGPRDFFNSPTATYIYVNLTVVSVYISAIMPRIARIVIPQMPHHITQRGNIRQDVFLLTMIAESIWKFYGSKRKNIILTFKASA